MPERRSVLAFREGPGRQGNGAGSTLACYTVKYCRLRRLFATQWAQDPSIVGYTFNHMVIPNMNCGILLRGVWELSGHWLKRLVWGLSRI